MKKTLVVVCLALGLGGCGFAQGFRDEGLRQAADIAGAVVTDKLGDEFAELKMAVGEIPGKLPEPRTPVEDGTLYGLGGLVAYILGSLGKGMYRQSKEKNA